MIIIPPLSEKQPPFADGTIIQTTGAQFSDETKPVLNTPFSDEESPRTYPTEFDCWVREETYIRGERFCVQKDLYIICSHTIYILKI